MSENNFECQSNCISCDLCDVFGDCDCCIHFCYDFDICADCIFNPVNESRSEDLQNKNAQIVVPDDACCDMCGIAETNLFYFPVGIMPLYICSNCAAIMLME